MLYPASIMVDFHIQADSLEEAQEILSEVIKGNHFVVKIDDVGYYAYPEVNLDDMEISNNGVIDVEED